MSVLFSRLIKIFVRLIRNLVTRNKATHFHRFVQMLYILIKNPVVLYSCTTNVVENVSLRYFWTSL